MRVALLARGAHPLHEPGGMERAVYHLAGQLKKLGLHPTLYTRPALHDKPFPGEVVVVPYRRWPAGPHGSVLDRTINYPIFAERAGERVARDARSGRIDVIDAQGIAGLGYLRARRRDPELRAPVLINPQGMEEHKTRGFKRLALWRLRRLSREAARLADRVVATDESIVGEIPEYLAVDPSRVVLLRNGVDIEEIDAITPLDARGVVGNLLPALGGADPVLISVGRLEEYKGFGDVLEALIRLHASARLPEKWAWIVLGDGSLRPAMEKRIAEHDGSAGVSDPVSPHVHFAGWVRDLPALHAYYARSDVFVHATHYEGSSIVTIEAMAHSLPVVGARAGGIPDKVSDGENGFLVRPGAIDALAERIAALSADAGLRKDMGHQGRERVERRFSWESIARSTVAVYEELVRESRA
ncbi:MAG: glycosyltransferase family 4 protein [Vicinamibacteria bacterium]|nr:glycosyltransferase family 4 protein [Vicinamibacteria bacterium]